MASKKSRRQPDRPFGQLFALSGRALNRAARLALRAGSAHDQTMMEELEPRKLLAITIQPGDVNPATGLGTATGYFDYFIPYLFQALPAPVANTILVEEFQDEADPWATLNPATPPSGTFFSTSNIQISYSPTGAFPQLENGTGPGDPANDRDMRVALSATGTMTFTFFEGDNAQNRRPRLVLNSSFTIGQSFLPGAPSDGTGLDTSATGTKVELLRAGQVVATFSGAALAALGTPTLGFPGDLRFDFTQALGFDAVRFSSAQNPPDNASYTDNFRIDDIRATLPTTRFAQGEQRRLFTAFYAFTGPVGASLAVLDLYGREEIYNTLQGIPPGGQLPIADPLGTGVVNANDGIGQIILAGTNALSTLTMIGGTHPDTGPILVGDPKGQFSEFEGAGFGFALTNANPPAVIGLPPAGGSIIVGSPFVRNNATPALYLTNPALPVPDDFVRPDQGVRVTGGASVGSVMIHAAMFGSSTFSGAVGRYSVGLLLGSTTVQGDLGALFVNSDAGLWVRDDVTPPPPTPFNPTNSQLTVGRTVGQVIIGARSIMNVSVIGDVNNTARPRIDLFHYNEQEVVYGINPATNDGPRVTLAATLNRGTSAATQAVLFGTEYFRNDTILGAEWVGGTSSGVQITGTLGQQDPINRNEDPSDVYAFPADGSADVVASLQIPFPPGQNAGEVLARIVDQEGRVLASHEFVQNSASAIPGQTGVRIAFRPDHADVYYLVVAVPNDGNFATALAYQVTMTGLAPTTFGMYRTSAGTGDPNTPPTPPFINVQSGSMGSFRVGTGYVGGDGGEHDTFDVQNHNDGVDDNFNWNTSTLSVAGSLYNITTGSDVAVAQVFVGRNLGRFVTGMSNVVGTGPGEGDLNILDLSVGGTMGVLDVRGAISWEQDPTPGPAGPVFVRTGTAGGRGDIGAILVGAFINSDRDGNSFIVRTSPGSTINQFLVGITGGDGGLNGDLTRGTPRFTLGTGSDLRFADFGLIQSATDPDAFRRVNPGSPVVLSDDTGTVVTIEVRGGTAGSGANVRFLPIDGSQGVAIARIDATLNGGAELRITGIGPGVASIGRIRVTTDTGTLPSTVTITGTAQVDVLRIDQVAGNPLLFIQNTTPGGDIVAVDVIGLGQLTIARGNLGRTQSNGVGPARLGPYLDIQGGMNNTVGGALGVTVAGINPNWAGGIRIPVNAATADVGQETLEDLGSPINGYLNGLVVRTGSVTSVTVSGTVGDVYLQDGAGTLGSLVANSDSLHASPGAFEGIDGIIYATTIGTIDVGDGVSAPGPSPFASAGIFADDDIRSVIGGRGLSPVIRGAIIADNQNLNPGPANDGVVAVTLTGGRYDGAFIGSTFLDWFWNSARYEGRRRDEARGTGEVVALNGINSDLFRSQVLAINVLNITISGGAYDASWVIANGDIGVIRADEYRNTTRLGEPTEFRRSEIDATHNLTLLATNGGDIADLVIDIQGSVLNSVTGRNTARLDLRVAQTVNDLSLTNDIRATTVTAGRLNRAFAGGDIRSSQFDIAGPIVNITAASNITSTRVNNTGPDGRIDLIQARFFLTGDISSSGPINTIISTEGDILASIETTDTDGSLNLLSAGHDLLVSLDIAGNINRLVAARNIGSPTDAPGARTINVRGNLGSIETTHGQLYADVTVGQAITGFIRNARVAALPGNDLVARATIRAFGPINLIDWNGDLNGSIISESGGISTVRITDGSFRPGNQIVARDGGIDQVTITGGHLLGDIISEFFINAVHVLPNAAGFFGEIGVNPYLSQFVPFDGLRNQLPPGVAPIPTFQGPRIQAGTNIGLVEVTKAGLWEAGIVAGYSIGRVAIFGVILNDTITPGLGASFIVAGDTVSAVDAGQFAGGIIIGAGIKGLGADDRPGGTGANADTVQFGRIGALVFRGGTGAVTIEAGMDAGADGFYTLNPGPDGVRGTADDINDDSVADGISSIGSVTVFGAVLQTTAYADNGIGFTSAGIIRGGPGLHQQNPGRVIEVPPSTGAVPVGFATPFATPSGETGRITFTGPGQASYNVVFNSTLGRNVGQLALVNTSLASRIIVDTDQNSLTDFQILSNDGSSLGFGSFRGNLLGASSFYYDGYVQTVEFGALNTTGIIGAGNDIGSLTFGQTTRGNIFANYITTVIVGGDFGLLNTTGEAVMDVLAASTIIVGGNHHGLITAERDIGSVRIFGEMNRGLVRAGASINSFIAPSMSDSRLSVRNTLGPVSISGSVTDSILYAGADLGFDGQFGGVGPSADTITNGAITSVFIGGNLVRSDIAAGIARGSDGYLGTPDDQADEGRSSIGPITIVGQAIGSVLGSQSYRIVSTGTLGSVFAAGSPFTSLGNMSVEALGATSIPVQVTDMSVTWDAGVYTATIQFSQPIDSSTLSPALRIAEVRASGAVQIILGEGPDYSVAYNPAANTAVVRFAQAITSRDLPVTPGLPGPGIYRFVLQSSVLRGQTQNARLDGNNNGFAASTDEFSQDAVVGDAGDKLADTVANSNGTRIDFRAATDLDQVLDNNLTANGLPDANSPYTLRGVIGDHPDQDVNNFRAAGDADLYKITLRAGQILRLGAMQGNALLTGRAILSSAGIVLADNTAGIATGGNADPVRRLAAKFLAIDELSTEDNYLITVTGTYFLLVTPFTAAANVIDGTAVANLPATAGTTGDYRFTIDVFDDGDTGFAGDTDSGDGVRVANAPTPVAFAGPDLILGNTNDLPFIAIGSFVFAYSRGADGVVGTPANKNAARDDVVSGSNGSGIFSQRTAGPDLLFGTSDDAVTSFVSAAIGEGGAAGQAVTIQPDIDVYHLNNRDPILPGTVVRVTLDLTELGSNLGLTEDPLTQGDLRGDVQLAVFDTSGATGVGDALLYLSSSDLKAVGGQPGKVVSNGVTSYGYDSDGNFFLQFVTTGRLGVAGSAPAAYAVYVQGATRADYNLRILTQGTATLTPGTQNVVIETLGGVINWLEAGRGVTTTLAAYTASVIGFTGLVGGQPVDSFILSSLITNLQGIFAAAGMSITLSTTPASFEGQDYSTVFLTGSNEPASFFNNGTFGASQHVDALNSDHRDQAVVFMPSLGVLGYGPDQAGVDSLVKSLTGAVARRIGELVGLRTLDNVGPGNPMAADSPTNIPGGVYRYSTADRRLSGSQDILFNNNFYLGNQNDVALLDRIL